METRPATTLYASSDLALCRQCRAAEDRLFRFRQPKRVEGHELASRSCWAFWVRGAERGGEGLKDGNANHRHQTLLDPGNFVRGFSQMADERSNRPEPRRLRSDAIPLPVLPAIIMGPWDDGLDGLLMMLLDESQVKHDR